jgi:hypothetical protein
MRILIATEPRTYREAMECALSELRPDIEARAADPEEIDPQVESFKPHLVLSTELTEKVKENDHALVYILLHNAMHAIICRYGEIERIYDLGFDDVLTVVDETYEHISQGA